MSTMGIDFCGLVLIIFSVAFLAMFVIALCHVVAVSIQTKFYRQDGSQIDLIMRLCLSLVYFGSDLGKRWEFFVVQKQSMTNDLFVLNMIQNVVLLVLIFLSVRGTMFGYRFQWQARIEKTLKNILWSN